VDTGNVRTSNRTQGTKARPKKALLSLRIDSDVIEWFKEQGAGYQSRMNALLRAYMEAHK
jgi:uncharacterized protein (DUF4415 family)